MNLQNLISTAQVGVPQTDESETIVNHILTELKKGKTAWRTSFKSQFEVDSYKEQLLSACKNNGINSMDKVEKGLKTSRDNPSPFLPDVGTFISWCKPEPRHFEHLAIEQADKIHNENILRIAQNPVNKDVGREALNKLKESMA